MKRFLAKHYDATGYVAPTNTFTFDLLEGGYAVTSKQLQNIYLDNLVENVADFYLTPANSLIILGGYLYIQERGTYTFQVTTTSGVSDLYVDNEYLASSYATSGVGSIFLEIGICPIKFRFVGSGGYSIKWDSPSSAGYIFIPEESRPLFGFTLFPFQIYNSVSETLKHDYKINGQEYQARERYAPSQPYKTFQVTLKQDSVYDRLLLKSWFSSLRGKLIPFLFASNSGDLEIKKIIIAGDTTLTIKKNYSSISSPYVNKILYIKEINLATPITSVSNTSIDGVECEVLQLADALPVDVSGCDIQFIYFCRLDTDTLTFELEDINFSSVRLSIKELYNDYWQLALF